MPSVFSSTCTSSARAVDARRSASGNVRAIAVDFTDASYFSQKKYATFTAIRTRSVIVPGVSR
jgi:hypothetical protein